MEKKRISELETRTMEFNQHEQQREDRMKKKMNRALVSCGIITKDLIFLSLESQNRRRKRMKLSIKKNTG